MAYFETHVLDNQIKALDTIGTASGSIATFDTDMAERLVNLEVAITATGGGGTPVSPIAINGFSACDLVACGKNLFNKATIVNNKVWTGNGEQSASGFFHSDFIKVKPNTIYYSNSNGSGFYYTIYFFDSSKTLLGRANVGAPSAFTTTAETVYIIMNNNPSDTPLDDLQLTEGNTAQAYSAYNGTTETIPFGQTVYGGRLNVGSGVLTVDKKLAVFNGSENWLAFGTKGFITNLSDMKSVNCYEEGLVNWLPFTQSSSIFGIELGSNNKTIYCMQMVGNVTGVTDLASWKSYLSNNNLEFTYPLNTNIVLQLDSKQIQSIIGTNNIYADTGDIIDLKYILSVGKAIN